MSDSVFQVFVGRVEPEPVSVGEDERRISGGVTSTTFTVAVEASVAGVCHLRTINVAEVTG